MKKLLALLIVSVLIVSLTACGNSGKDEPAQPVTDNTAAEPLEEEANEAVDVPADEPQDDAAVVEELKARLVGDWVFSEMERLTFNADGTGAYKGLEDRNYTFTYEVYIDHREYSNGAPYDENILKINYSTGETEDIIFFFNDNGQMAFHSFEGGGYTGMMYALDVFTKA